MDMSAWGLDCREDSNSPTQITLFLDSIFPVTENSNVSVGKTKERKVMSESDRRHRVNSRDVTSPIFCLF